MYRCGLIVVLLFLLSTPSAGQPPRSRDSSTRVVIMASDSALGTTHALVLRRAALNPREVIRLCLLFAVPQHQYSEVPQCPLCPPW